MQTHPRTKQAYPNWCRLKLAPYWSHFNNETMNENYTEHVTACIHNSWVSLPAIFGKTKRRKFQTKILIQRNKIRNKQ